MDFWLVLLAHTLIISRRRVCACARIWPSRSREPASFHRKNNLRSHGASAVFTAQDAGGTEVPQRSQAILWVLVVGKCHHLKLPRPSTSINIHLLYNYEKISGPLAVLHYISLTCFHGWPGHVSHDSKIKLALPLKTHSLDLLFKFQCCECVRKTPPTLL